MNINFQLLEHYLGNAVIDTGLLMLLVAVDTILALSYTLSVGKKFTSAKMLSGILRNLLLSLVPLGIQALVLLEPRHDDLYSFVSVIFFIFICWGVLVSIVSYLSLLGIKFPGWLLNLVSEEVKSKIYLKGDDNNGTNSGESGQSQSTSDKISGKN